MYKLVFLLSKCRFLFANIYYLYFSHFVLLAPSAPTQVKVVVVSSSQLDVSWQPPLEPNGVITGYDITWMMTKNDLDEPLTGETKRTSLDASKRMYSITNLG